MGDAPGWHRDPELDDQQRDADGSDWTDRDRDRPAGAAPSPRLPEHVPELHRALAAAVDDIDAVEDRLSMLFDRPGGATREQTWSPPPVRSPEREADDEILELLLDDGDVVGVDHPHSDVAVQGRDDTEGDDDGLFAELDAALAAEAADDAEEPDEPDEPVAGLFRRR